MTDSLRELDCQIAEKVMGWKHQNDHWWHSSWPDIHNTVGFDRVPAYSTDIGAAMTVVKIMRLDREFHVFELRFVAVWMARFQNIITGAKGGFSADHPSVSASEVICRAALKAIQQEGHDEG